jgi:hypothetical protein
VCQHLSILASSATIDAGSAAAARSHARPVIQIVVSFRWLEMTDPTYALIQRLRRALYLTSIDAERNGFTYGPQSICVKALADSAKWLEVNKPSDDGVVP